MVRIIVQVIPPEKSLIAFAGEKEKQIKAPGGLALWKETLSGVRSYEEYPFLSVYRKSTPMMEFFEQELQQAQEGASNTMMEFEAEWCVFFDAFKPNHPFIFHVPDNLFRYIPEMAAVREIVVQAEIDMRVEGHATAREVFKNARARAEGIFREARLGEMLRKLEEAHEEQSRIEEEQRRIEEEEEQRRARAEAMEIIRKEKQEKLDRLYAVVVSAVALLAMVYQYLAGNIDRGGTKTYSPGSLVFRSSYVSIVLFQGAYIWIKFRDVAPTGSGDPRRPRGAQLSRTIQRSVKPTYIRYKPPRNRGHPDEIHLGRYATDKEAQIKKKIAAFYYGGHNFASLDFDNGSSFRIPPMAADVQQNHSVEGKRKWVQDQVTAFYKHITESIDINTVHLISEGPNVAIHRELRVEDYDEPLHLQDDHVEDATPPVNNQRDGSSNIEPRGTSYLGGGSGNILNVAHRSCEAGTGGLTNEGALLNPQAVSSFPTMSPSSALQRPSDAMAVMPGMGNSTSPSETIIALSLKVINLHEQLSEKDKELVEVKRENERLQLLLECFGFKS